MSLEKQCIKNILDQFRNKAEISKIKKDLSFYENLEKFAEDKNYYYKRYTKEAIKELLLEEMKNIVKIYLERYFSYINK